MPTKKPGRSGNRSQEMKSFNKALKDLEKTAKELMRQAPDPAATGIKLAERIRKVVEKIEVEASIEEIDDTEACMIGVGVGVF